MDEGAELRRRQAGRAFALGFPLLLQALLTSMRARAVTALLLASVLASAAACSQGGGASTAGRASPTATVAPSFQQPAAMPTGTRPAGAEATVAASPAAQATATPSAPAQPSPPAAAAPLAGVQASISASCRSSGGSAEITVRYSISVVGEGRLTRVRLLDNGQVVDDTGPISETAVTRQKVLPGGGGASHTFQLWHEPAAQSPTNTRSTVSC